ncbi:uncharacterized protein UHOD_11171 [Ustilago sp. UG-2017b]|nr:uncharacterized protein UHOD_11171 [Ustilago sp. UG-2017b]
MHTARSSMSMVSMEAALSMEVALRPCLLPVPARPLASCSTIPKPAMVVFFRALAYDTPLLLRQVHRRVGPLLHQGGRPNVITTSL